MPEAVWTQESIEAKARKCVMDVLERYLEEEQIVREASFIDSLGADSLELIELTMTIEEEFRFEISDEDAEKILTFGELVNYIVGRLEVSE